ncbi:MAG: type IV toxin-antitoxin system AbiEi family antitoxin domain-containing protein [Chlamydiota bacterium]
MKTTRNDAKAQELFKQHGGMLRTTQALALGIHPRTLYRLRDQGKIVQLTRGLYRLAGLPRLGNPDLATASAKIPSAIVCMISALSFHGITTQIPHAVDIALPRGSKQPRLDYPPLRVFRFTGKPFTEGVESHLLDGVAVRIYSPAKTVADCFRLRNRIGIDVAVEALRFCLERKKNDAAQLLRYARLCRVERVMMPYLEALQ